MLIFMKNAKKILSKDEALSVIRYHAGRAYVSNRYSCIWVEDASGREGTFDLQSNLMCENAAMPNYDKLLPPIIGSEPYTIVCTNEFTEFLAAMKPVNACTPKKQIATLLLVWRTDGLTAYMRSAKMDVSYRFSSMSTNIENGQTFYAAFDARRLSDLVDYFRQRTAPVRFYPPVRKYAPLRMEVDTELISAVPAGGLIAPLTRFEEERFADVIPDRAE